MSAIFFSYAAADGREACSRTECISHALALPSSAFFAQLCEWRFPKGEPIGPVFDDERSTIIPALELFFNGCATMPEAGTLLSYEFATEGRAEVRTGSFHVTITSLEPADALRFYVENVLNRHHFAGWLAGILSYDARDTDQCMCTSARMADYACADDDTALLTAMVCFREISFQIVADSRPGSAVVTGFEYGI